MKTHLPHLAEHMDLRQSLYQSEYFSVDSTHITDVNVKKRNKTDFCHLFLVRTVTKLAVKRRLKQQCHQRRLFYREILYRLFRSVEPVITDSSDSIWTRFQTGVDLHVVSQKQGCIWKTSSILLTITKINANQCFQLWVAALKLCFDTYVKFV